MEFHSRASLTSKGKATLVWTADSLLSSLIFFHLQINAIPAAAAASLVTWLTSHLFSQIFFSAHHWTPILPTEEQSTSRIRLMICFLSTILVGREHPIDTIHFKPYFQLFWGFFMPCPVFSHLVFRRQERFLAKSLRVVCRAGDDRDENGEDKNSDFRRRKTEINCARINYSDVVVSHSRKVSQKDRSP